MNYRLFRLLLGGVLLIAALAAVGSYTYQLGIAHGIAESGRLATPTGSQVVVAYWPRPWGFGFGFFPIFPLLFFLVFWLFVARALFWRRRWHQGGGGWGSRGVPPVFEEWHRRMHEQQPPSTTHS